MARKAGLGRGLDALFADVAPIEEGYNADSLKDLSGTADKKNKDEKAATDRDRIIYIDINDIRPNSAQPRTVFDEEKLKELADSIKANGVIQPLLVPTSQPAPRKSSSLLQLRAKVLRLSFLVLTKTSSKLLMKSSPTLPAPPTVLHQL